MDRASACQKAVKHGGSCMVLFWVEETCMGSLHGAKVVGRVQWDEQ